MKNAILFSLVSLALCACGPISRQQPDGGRALNQCAPEPVSIAVKVVDAEGNPVEGAIVTATNQTSGQAATAQTRGDGTTSGITQEKISPGTVLLRASLGTRVSEVKQVTWVCGECHCTAEPDAIIITLSS
ncbi:MAG: carboxypeptidase regulatory-like domain-containing protein [Myxococcales bacterium]|nr:carboxypeptidase regulatory-like domain-containing protein [Myxococcales bacterium]